MASFYHGVYFTTVSMVIVEPTLHHNCSRILLIYGVFSNNIFDNFIQIHFTTFKIEQFFSFAVFQTFWYLITVDDQMFLTFLQAFSVFVMPCRNVFFSFFQKQTQGFCKEVQHFKLILLTCVKLDWWA